MLLNAPASTNDFLAQLKAVLVAPDVALENVTRFRDWVYSLAADGQTATAKAALAAQYADLTSAQLDTVIAALSDLDALRKVANAAGTQASTNDFFFNAKKCVGPTVSRR